MMVLVSGSGLSEPRVPSEPAQWDGDSPHVPLSGFAEIKLGKNRTEAEVKRYTEEKERLEKRREEIRAHLAQLRRQKRELKETLLKCSGRGLPGWDPRTWLAAPPAFGDRRMLPLEVLSKRSLSFADRPSDLLSVGPGLTLKAG